MDANFRLNGKLYAEKYSKVFLWNPWNTLMRMQRKKDRSCTLQVGPIKSLPCAKMLDITHESYGFSVDLIETIN